MTSIWTRGKVLEIWGKNECETGTQRRIKDAATDRVKVSYKMETDHDRLDFWKNQWNVKVPFWHKSSVNPLLTRNWQRCQLQSFPARVFVPLCGKTVDMRWLYDQGHLVVGLDGIEGPVVDFFDEQNLDYRRQEVDQLIRFSTKDGRLVIYICDMMETDPKQFGKFDLIWDRGSLVAIKPQDRQKYAKFMKGVIGPGTNYLLDAIMYEQSRYPGPPMNVSHQVIQELYGDVCEAATLETVPRTFHYLKNYGAGLGEQDVTRQDIDTEESYEVVVLLKSKRN